MVLMQPMDDDFVYVTSSTYRRGDEVVYIWCDEYHATLTRSVRDIHGLTDGRCLFSGLPQEAVDPWEVVRMVARQCPPDLMSEWRPRVGSTLLEMQQHWRGFLMAVRNEPMQFEGQHEFEQLVVMVVTMPWAMSLAQVTPAGTSLRVPRAILASSAEPMTEV